VLLPARNRRDFEEIPEETRAALEFVWLETVDDAISAAASARSDAPGAAAAIT
jgi:ATP-dependent Lon protease